MGSPGQSNYAAANASLEVLADAQQHSGVHATALLWGPWASGMALRDPSMLQRFERVGMGAVTGWLRL